MAAPYKFRPLFAQEGVGVDDGDREVLREFQYKLAFSECGRIVQACRILEQQDLPAYRNPFEGLQRPFNNSGRTGRIRMFLFKGRPRKY